MQFWFRINNESELKDLSLMMKTGFTTNVVGPFLSEGFNLDFIDAFPHVCFWDYKTVYQDDFSTLEILASKAAYSNKLKFIIDVSDTSIQFLLQLVSIIDVNNVCLYVKNNLNLINFFSYVNMNFHSMILNGSNDTEQSSYIDLRNQYMKKTRIGFKLYIQHINGLKYIGTPDFVLLSLEDYKLVYNI